MRARRRLRSRRRRAKFLAYFLFLSVRVRAIGVRCDTLSVGTPLCSAMAAAAACLYQHRYH